MCRRRSFFRGVIQEQLHRWREHRGTSQPIVITQLGLLALVFSAIHITVSYQAFVVVALAGFVYSLVYAKTRRIEAAILAHFIVNAVHFLLFTYPYLQQP
jgi:uncharacterized protein